jgi:SnoaL-like domain
MCEEDGIRRVIARFAQFVDDRRFGDIAGLFADDGVLNLGSAVLNGRSANSAYFSKGPFWTGLQRHAAVNSVIVVSGAEASAVSDLLFFRAAEDGGVVARSGRYEDELVRVNGEWHFARRTHRTEAWSALGELRAGS